MWGYLTEFWGSITEVVVSAGIYTVDWFQSLGNAVAGAIGGMFDWLIHYINDLFIFAGWTYSIIRELILILILPITFIFNFIKSFMLSASSTPIVPNNTYVFSNEILDVFHAIPMWDTITAVVGLTMIVVGAFAIIKTLLWIT